MIPNKTPRVLNFPLAIFFAAFAGLSGFLGSSARNEIVPDPLVAALVSFICIFLLLIPFLLTHRDKEDILSPESMGGFGYLIYVGVGAFTNYTWPGLAVNPSLFEYLPIGIFLQTAGALAFFVGTLIAKQKRPNLKTRATDFSRLMIVLAVYAGFSLYLSFIMPRADLQETGLMIRAGGQVSWVFTVGPTILLQSLPMLIAALIYFRKSYFNVLRYFILIIFSFSTTIFVVSGSRNYGTQTLLLLLIAYLISSKKASRGPIIAFLVVSFLVLISSTSMRLSSSFGVNINPGTMNLESVFSRIARMSVATGDVGIRNVAENIKENLIYHLSDNQTMAMVFQNKNYKGFLFGRGLFYSLLSGLPTQMRPSWYGSATKLIIDHYYLVKERAIDAPYWPDWQMSIGVLGYADFGIIGLILYPFIFGFFVRWLYDRTVISKGLGQAGWLLYVPLVFVLWNPLLYGPDSIQSLRLLLPLAIAIKWSTSKAFTGNEVVFSHDFLGIRNNR